MKCLPSSVVNERLVFVEVGVVETELFEEPLHKLLERLPDHRLDDGRQQREAVRRVVELVTWSKTKFG